MPAAERTTTATVVFTDMVGSTAQRARLGEEQADALQRVHDRILQTRVEANGGQILKRLGDGMVAVFAGASEGLTATVEIQQAMARYNGRPGVCGELSLRIGLSTGDVSWEDGDCFGTPMVEAARLQAAAAGGQILCSDLVRMLARGRGGHEFVPLGFLELKGLPEPVATCEVVWAPATEVEFPLPPELAGTGDRPFVSRASEMDLAERLLGDPTRERAAVIWLLGEPGIGKTRLATEIARRAHAGSVPVFFGRCNEDLRVPYQPFLEALRFFAAQLPDAELEERLGGEAAELIRLLPELAGRLQGAEPSRGGGPEVEKYRLFEAVRSWLAAAGGPGPVLAVLDDLHWAAPPTLALLGHVARSAEASRVLFVCTARNTSPDDNAALGALVEDLDRKGVPSHRLELSGLDVDDVGELVSHAAGRRLDERLRNLASELTAETAGNPLFLDALLTSLPADPAWRPGALPTNVVETIRRRVARLSAEVQDLLRVAAVIGLDFELPVAARAGQCREIHALDALEAAGRAGLVVESGVDRYRFTHALVRSALRDDLSRSRRVRIHLAVGEAIETVHGQALDEHAAALAYHFYEAAPAGVGERAYRYSLVAAERAWRLLSFSEAADAYGRAIELLTHAGEVDSLTRARLLLAQGTAQRRAGDYGFARETLRTAFAEAAARDAAELEAEVAIAYEDASFEPAFPGDVAVELLQAASAKLGDDESPLSVMTAASLSRAYFFSGRLQEGKAIGDAALARARHLADPAVTAPVLARIAFSFFSVPDSLALAELGSELMDLATRLDDGMLQFLACSYGLMPAAVLGDMAAFDRWLERLHFTGQRVGHPIWKLMSLELGQFRAFMAGDLQLVERLLEEIQEMKLVTNMGLEGMVGVMMFLLRREQGRLDEIAPVLRHVVALNPEGTLWGPGLAALYAEVGILDDARVVLERLAADDFAALPIDATRELCLGLCAEAAAAVGDARRADALIDHLLPCEDMLMFFWGTNATLGPCDRLLGMLASVAGRHDEAERWFERALAFSRRMESPLWVAHCLFDHAAHRRRHGLGGDEAMLTEAAELCRRHGLAGLGQKIARVAG